MRLLEAGQIVNDLRLNELEGWRRKDEPRVARLSTAAEIADAVRDALADRGRRTWKRWHIVVAGIVTLVTVAGGVASFLNAIGVL